MADPGVGTEAPPLDVELLKRIEEFYARRKERAAKTRREFEAHGKKQRSGSGGGGTCGGG